MRTQITSVALAALMGAEALARKQLVGQNDTRLRSPEVGSDTCEEYCFVGTSSEDKIYWCLTFDEPIVKLGWEYDQTANTDEQQEPNRNFRQDLTIYLTQQLKITSTLDVYRLLYNQLMFELPQFSVKLNMGFTVNQFAQICPVISWEHQAVGLNSTFRSEFMNCSKVLINNLWSVEGTYTGKAAKYIEECARSQADPSSTADEIDKQVTATLWKQDDLVEALSETLLYGTFDPASVTYCTALPGASTSSSAGPVLQVYNNLLTYYQTYYGGSGTGEFQLL